ncbi:arabinosaccharide transport system substrate-binding protein [Planifilum fulgidum]|jgi:arabinosaccharide transport system substrate-binding protein|uniref:Arabinosaccharide transport system substrate-binding protein n=1 Tax=Planifilum fulgidum TaxID=201973 RepID=A0A1I2MB33_9BACL|nr:sugar ABC transporter substrate-binding protein [Bacillota bacterium]MBO2531954.1 sugar ABC transporter substrate-binding protein [Thermoactinomycetaceae bacterium]SFF88724.1 arabinosaccharide transport system substrate-binding protein [Planifilum fulgidum]
MSFLSGLEPGIHPRFAFPFGHWGAECLKILRELIPEGKGEPPVRKRVGLLSIIALLWTALFAGCSSAAETSSDGKTTLTLWTFASQHVEFYEEMAKEWNRRHPDKPIDLQIEMYPYNEMHNKLLLSLYSKVGAPDIADIEIGKFANYLKGEPQLVPLNDIVDPVKDRIVQSRIDIYSKDGTVYGIGFHVGATVIFYNKEILDQAGVDPDQIKTWNDFVAAGKKVKSKTGKPMITIDVTEFFAFWPLIIQQGSDYLDENGEVILDNKINVETLTFLHDLIYKHQIAIPTPGGGHHAEEYYGFMNRGGAASVIMPMWYMGRFTDFMPDLKGKMIIRPLPAWEEGGLRSAGMGGTGTVVTNQSKHPELAKEFLSFAKLSKEGNIKIWEILGFDPIRWDVWDEPEMKADNKYTEYFGKGIFDTLLEVKDEINSPNLGEKTPLVNGVVGSNVLYHAIKTRDKTPAEALREAAARLRQ